MSKKIIELTPADIASITDHTFLARVDAYRGGGVNAIKARAEAFDNFLKGTLELPFKPYAVCVQYDDVGQAVKYLEGSGIKTAAVAGFPEGSKISIPTKLFQAKYAIDHGADEIDFVMNYDALKAGDIQTCLVGAYRMSKLGAVTKMILETSELNAGQIVEACGVAKYYGLDFVKTSSGYTGSGARSEDLEIMRENTTRGVKASGKVNWDNVYGAIRAMSGRTDGKTGLDPMRERIGAGASFLEGYVVGV